MSESTTPKKQLPMAVRALLVFVSVLLCICLTVSLLAATLITDLRQINNRDTFRQAVNVLFSARISQPRMSQTPGQTDSLLTDMIYDFLKDQDIEGFDVDKDALANFIEESTVSEFLSDKAADYIEDLISGTENATLTTDELMSLVTDNKELLEETFDITLDEQTLQTVRDYVSEADIGTVLHEQILSEVRNTSIAGDTNLGQIFDIINALCEDRIFITLWAIVAVLMIALFFSNRMRFGGMLICSGICGLLVGAILCLPLLAIGELLPMLGSFSPEVMQLIGTFTGAISPMHFGVLIVGAVALIAGIVVASITHTRRKAC